MDREETDYAYVRRPRHRDHGPRHKVFEFVREPANLPRWAHAFVSAGDGRARLETPAGTVDIGLEVSADAQTGTVAWRLAFPDPPGLQTPNRHHVCQNLILIPTTTCLGIVCKCKVTDL
jgi:hypothetical protein